MVNILLSGACGKMGRAVAACAAEDSELNIMAGVDRAESLCAFPVFKSFDDVSVTPDVIIDFSNVSALDDLLKFALQKNVPVIIATTGYNERQINDIKSAAEKIAVFFTFNMSLGVNLLCSLAKRAASVLGSGFDIEIIEKHHNLKLDAPSGTAIMLANAVNSQFDDSYTYEYDRHSKRQKRPKKEIGIHSVRGGTIVGEHDVIFAGHDEVLTLSHSAQSKEIFANGALRAAKFISGKAAGLYDMNDVLNLE